MGFERVDELHLESFAPHLNTKFRVRYGAGQTVEMELIEAYESSTPPGVTSRQERFSLIFNAPPDCPLGQGLYEFEHDAMGEFPLFVTPVWKDEKGLCFQAVFNRFVE